MTHISEGKELKDGISEGARKIGDTVSSTLGPFGRTVILRNSEGKLTATKDGVSVAKEFHELTDPIENAAAQLIKKVAIKCADESGDGTTTATLLASNIIQEGLKVVDNHSNVIKVKKGIDLAVKEVVDYLRNNSVEITENSQIKEVATVSGNNDETVGELISTALDKVGRDGIVSLEKSKSGETYLEVVEGMQFDRGWKSPYFVTDNNTMSTTLEKPIILIYNGRLTSAKDILATMQMASMSESKSLVIIAEDIEGEALSILLVNKSKGIVNSVAVKAPDFGDRRTATLEDLATITGGTVISPEKGMIISKMDEKELGKYLGSSRNVTVNKEKTTIVDGKCTPESIDIRVEEIKKQIELSRSPFEKEKLQERLGRMIGGVALISVGGNSEIEIDELYDRVEDALYAAQSSIEEGIVAGGGAALIHAIKSITIDEDRDINNGKNIIKKVCSLPFSKILSNSGMEPSEIYSLLNNVRDGGIWDGYDLKQRKMVNMRDNGIIDPLKVVRKALENASSIAGVLLTTNSYIYQDIDND